jgi:hypothetical protein
LKVFLGLPQSLPQEVRSRSQQQQIGTLFIVTDQEQPAFIMDVITLGRLTRFYHAPGADRTQLLIAVSPRDRHGRVEFGTEQ